MKIKTAQKIETPQGTLILNQYCSSGKRTGIARSVEIGDGWVQAPSFEEVWFRLQQESEIANAFGDK